MDYIIGLLFIVFLCFYVIDFKRLLCCLLLLFIFNTKINEQRFKFDEYQYLNKQTYSTFLFFVEKFKKEPRYRKATIIKDKIITNLNRLLFEIENDIHKELKLKRKIRMYDAYLTQKLEQKYKRKYKQKYKRNLKQLTIQNSFNNLKKV